jgi:SprT protein
MKKQETSIRVLEQFLPPDTFMLIAPFFQSHTIHLTLTHERKSVLGDYRNPTPDKPFHRISINANLNPYSFLITLLHELAHLLTFVHFKHTVSPHGKEWKTQFRHVLIPFIGKSFFPQDVEKALIAYIHNPAASTCTDPALYKALHHYDERKPGYKLVDELQIGERFAIEDGRIFEKTEALRTRSKCKEVKTGRMYYFQGIVEVRVI